MVGLIYEDVQLNGLVELSILLDFVKRIATVVPIKKDNDIAMYLAFAKDANSRHPFVAHVSVNSLERSSSISVQDNVEISLNKCSSFVSNDEVIREIS